MSEENPLRESKVTGTRMKDFHCDLLELRFDFASEDMQEDAFLQSAGIENREEFVDEDGDLAVGFTFDAREQTTDYHAHMRIWLFKKGGGKAVIDYHDAAAKDVGADPKLPHVEDFMPWLGTFLRTHKIKARINATFLFDDSFSTVIGLPFPLITTEKALAGALVTGLSILFPKEETMAVVQSTGDETFISLNTTSELSLTGFDLSTELKNLSASISHLIKRQKVKNENDTAQKDNKEIR